MGLALTIDSVSVYVDKDTLNIGNAVEARSTASFIVADPDGTSSYVRGQPVIITDGTGFIPPFPIAISLFNGVVYSSKERRMSPSGGLYHTVKCMDWHYLVDKLLIATSYTGQTAGAIVTDLITNYFAAEGVTAGTIQAGPTIAESVFNYAPGGVVMDVLAERAGFTWYIDAAKQLFFLVRTTTAAPFAVGPADFHKRSSSLTHGNPKYRNRQYIRGGKSLTSEQTETYTTTDATQTAFPVGYPLALVPTSIKEDAVAKTFGIKGLAVAKDYYWSKGDAVIVAAVAPGNGVVVEIIYYGEYDIIALAEDAAAIAAQLAIEGTGTGKVEYIDDDPLLVDPGDALEEAKAKNVKYAVAGKQLTFEITTSGLEPGQLLTVTEPLYGLAAAEMLITAVDIVETDIGIVYRVTAVEGPVLGGWEAFFGALSREKEDVRLTAGSANPVLIIPAATAENWDWTESIVENVYACTLVNGTVCGGALPIVC